MLNSAQQCSLLNYTEPNNAQQCQIFNDAQQCSTIFFSLLNTAWYLVHTNSTYQFSILAPVNSGDSDTCQVCQRSHVRRETQQPEPPQVLSLHPLRVSLYRCISTSFLYHIECKFHKSISNLISIIRYRHRKALNFMLAYLFFCHRIEHC